MEYDMPAVYSRSDMFGWLALVSLILLAGIIFYLGKNNKKVIFAASWFIIGILPVSGIIPINNVVSEHYLYLASSGFFLLLALGMLWLLSIVKMRIFAGIFIILSIIILGTLTILRNRDWHEPLRMYLEIISQTKQSFRAHNNAGVEYFRSGDLVKAEQYFRSSLEIQPTYAPAINNLGVIYRRKDNIAEAERLYKAAIQADPDYLLAHENLLGIYFTQNRIEEAKNELGRILEIHPHHPQAKELLNQLRDR
jgi:tetratricopeptide (TPR) repeat protein